MDGSYVKRPSGEILMNHSVSLRPFSKFIVALLVSSCVAPDYKENDSYVQCHKYGFCDGVSSGGGSRNTGGAASGGGTSSTGASCAVSSTDSACSGCGKGACCTELTACEQSSDCMDFYSCVSPASCTDTCVTNCELTYPEGFLLLTDLGLCAQDNCTSACSSSCDNTVVPTASGSLQVTAGYAQAGSLHGAGYTWIGSDANSTSCIWPYCGDSGCVPVPTGTALCSAGVVTTDTTSKSAVGFGMNVNQDQNAAAGVMSTVTIANSITVSVVGTSSSTNTGNAAARIQLDDDDDNHFCVDAGNWSSGVPIPITSFNTACWSPSTGTYATATTPIQSVYVLIPASSTSDRPFAMCLTNVTVQ
jgi:hypothetical protein